MNARIIETGIGKKVYKSVNAGQCFIYLFTCLFIQLSIASLKTAQGNEPGALLVADLVTSAKVKVMEVA